MWRIIAIFALLAGVGIEAYVLSTDPYNSWALLVAGSFNYHNYRHQADVSRAYHVILGAGVPPERIIVMMYDDIAYHRENPFPGVLMNKPGGPNVYEGVHVDYRGYDVNSRNFLHVLEGNRAAMRDIGTGRVIESDQNSNVFVYFTDHGAPGLIGFPHDSLSAVRLEQTLMRMHHFHRYSKLIMYIEACYSGSMFDNILPENTKIFVMTSAARDENSFGAHCHFGTCYGDEFSIAWMDQMESENSGTLDTFFHQYQSVRTAVKMSHVQIYGDMTLGAVGVTPKKNASTSYVMNQGNFISTMQIPLFNVKSKEIPLFCLRQKVAQAAPYSLERMKALQDLMNLIQDRKTVDIAMDRLVSVAISDMPQLWSTVAKKRLILNRQMFPCYLELIENFNKYCFAHEHEYVVHKYHILANICILQLNTTNLLMQMPSICSFYTPTLKGLVI